MLISAMGGGAYEVQYLPFKFAPAKEDLEPAYTLLECLRRTTFRYIQYIVCCSMRIVQTDLAISVRRYALATLV